MEAATKEVQKPKPFFKKGKPTKESSEDVPSTSKSKYVPPYRREEKSEDVDEFKEKKPFKRPGPSSSKVPPPTMLHRNANPTPQRNDSIIDESIFGRESGDIENRAHESFTPFLGGITEITEEVMEVYSSEETQIERKLLASELQYYHTALLAIRNVAIKQRTARQRLTDAEQQLLQIVKHDEFAIAEPIHDYLSSIGHVKLESGKVIEYRSFDTPNHANHGFGGHHSRDRIGLNNHNLYEEVPCLGICSRVIMIAARADHAADLVAPEGLLPDVANNKLLCWHNIKSGTRQEVKNRLGIHGIDDTHFPETITGTGFNYEYVVSLSRIVERLNGFKVDKVNLYNMTTAGSKIQLVTTITEQVIGDHWRKSNVFTQTMMKLTPGEAGAAIAFGFQQMKPENHWCCSVENAAQWNANKNARRNRPAGCAAETLTLITTFRQKLLG